MSERLRDRDGDVWEPFGDGTWWLPPDGEPRTLEDIRGRFGPLERVPEYAVRVDLTNETAGHRFAEFEERIGGDFLDDDGRPAFGEIFREMQRNYGRCTSSVYVDRDGKAERIGWFFVSRQAYEDTGAPYLRGAWVTLVEIPDPVPVQYVEIPA